MSITKEAYPTRYKETYIVNYAYVITNTGDTPLTGIEVTDVDTLGAIGPITCEPIVELPPNEQMTCTATTPNEIPIDAVITNIATVKANGVSDTAECTVECSAYPCNVDCT